MKIIKKLLKISAISILFLIGITILFGVIYNFFNPHKNKNLLTLMNEARAQVGAQPLVFNDVLKETSKKKACDMRDGKYFSHYDNNGQMSWHYFDESGIDWKYKGENLGEDLMGDEQVFDAWMDSPEHKKNILDPEFNQVGWYWCDRYVAQHFGLTEKDYKQKTSPTPITYE